MTYSESSSPGLPFEKRNCPSRMKIEFETQRCLNVASTLTPRWVGATLQQCCVFKDRLFQCLTNQENCPRRINVALTLYQRVDTNFDGLVQFMTLRLNCCSRTRTQRGMESRTCTLRANGLTDFRITVFKFRWLSAISMA